MIRGGRVDTVNSVSHILTMNAFLVSHYFVIMDSVRLLIGIIVKVLWFYVELRDVQVGILRSFLCII